MVHLTLLPAALALGGLNLRYCSDHVVTIVTTCYVLLPSAFQYFHRTADNTWCCLAIKLGVALEHLLVLTPLMQSDCLRWVSISVFFDVCFLKIIFMLYYGVYEGDFTLRLVLPLPALSTWAIFSARGQQGDKTQN